MTTFKIAFRNILRNRRRSAMTLLAIAVGAIGIILFGEFVRFVTAGLETNAIEKVGHLTVFKTGYFNFGAGNPAEFGIADYPSVIRVIREDNALKDKVAVVTPIVQLSGIAGNYDIDASKTFLGIGVVPSDRDRMLQWDEYGVNRRRANQASGLSDGEDTVGVIGVGMSRVLGLCERLHVPNCPPRATKPHAEGAALDSDVTSLAQADRAAPSSSSGAAPTGPRLDLLAATAGGAPNVVSLSVARAEPQGVRELDDNFVAMHIQLAQKLLYGRGEPKATGIVIQLHHTADMESVRSRLTEVFASHHLDLEVRDFAELQPFYKQAVGLFRAIFLFISIIMSVIVLFTVVNTMGMSVMERTTEIGTVRALGIRRSGIRRLFVIEGALLGALGATLGAILAQAIATLINHGSLTWTPPGQANPVPLEILTTGSAGFVLAVWLGLVIAATIAAFIPANRGARLPVVDALRHN